MSERAVPFGCPYCTEESLRPHGTTHGEWECRACRRAFALRLIGLIRPEPRPDSTEAGARP